MSTVGVQRVVDDADQARELFARADAIAERLCEQALMQLGVPPDARDAEVALLRAKIKDLDGD